jgi:diguanylate cyclase (GGDEF)-like protein
VEAGGRETRFALSPAHLTVFRDEKLRARLRDLVAIVARSSLLVASQRTLEAELRRISDTDGLSGVFTRRALDRELKREVDRSTRYHSSLCLLLIDIDRFKQINDTAGHQAGDAVIAGIGRILREVTRSTDVAARYGGDEFCLALPGIDIDRSLQFAARLREAAARLTVPGLSDTRVTLSIGIGAWEHGLDAAGLLGRADSAVYRVKESGRDGAAAHGSERVVRNP